MNTKPQNPPLFQLADLSFSYRQNKVFKNIDLQLQSGKFYGLIGANGSGKSTLFKLILGEEYYDEGDIIIPKGYRIGALR